MLLVTLLLVTMLPCYLLHRYLLCIIHRYYSATLFSYCYLYFSHVMVILLPVYISLSLFQIVFPHVKNLVKTRLLLIPAPLFIYPTTPKFCPPGEGHALVCLSQAVGTYVAAVLAEAAPLPHMA
jgi:hypothetical protein